MVGWLIGGWVVTMCNGFVCSKGRVNQRDENMELREDFLEVNSYELCVSHLFSLNYSLPSVNTHTC